MRVRLVFAALAALLSTAAALAQPVPQTAPRTAQFTVGTVRLQVVLPEGYCLADQALFDRTQGTIDKGQNTSHLLIVVCGAETLEQDFYAIKSPINTANLAITRQALLAQMKTTFASPELAGRMAALNAQGTAKTEANGARVDFKGGIKPFGTDETCAYIGGLLTVEGRDRTMDLAQGTCISAVGGRMFAVYSTGMGADPVDLARHMRASKALVLTVTAVP